jgi:hypothetical protein
MKKWLIAAITIASFCLGGAAFATKEHGEAVGNKVCKTCHEGAPKDKKLVPKVAEHVTACKAKAAADCKTCHDGKAQGSKKCK